MSAGRYVLGWDLLRLVAALDIVGHHVGNGHVFWGLGLPVFLLFGTMLGLSKAQPRSFLDFAKARAKRIVVPWLFWSLIISGLLALEASFGLPDRPFYFQWLMPLYGPEIHLWFLPFIAFAGCGSYALWRWLPESREMRMVTSFASGGCLVAAWEFSPEVVWPFQQWLFGLAAVPLGVALGRTQALVEDVVTRRREWLAHLGLMLVLPLAVEAYLRGGLSLDAIGARYCGALLLLVIASRWTDSAWWPRHPALQPAQYMLGVYILHPSVYRWLVSPILGPLGLSGEVWLRVGLTFVFSLAIVGALRLTKLKSVL